MIVLKIDTSKSKMNYVFLAINSSCVHLSVHVCAHARNDKIIILKKLINKKLSDTTMVSLLLLDTAT